MTSMTKGAPIVTNVRRTDHRAVLVNLANVERLHNGVGSMFLPDRLHLEWRDGVLTRCNLVGRALREDMQAWVDGRRTTREYLNVHNRPFHLDKATPEWVRALIDKFEPEEVT